MNFSRIARGFFVSMAAASALFVAGCGGEKVEKVDINAQVSALAGDTDAKVAALAELAKAGPEAANMVPKIQALLKDEDATVRRTAAYVLGAIGPAAKAAVPDLKAMLDTQDKDQLTAVGNALRSIEPSALPGLKVENVAGPGGGE
jgi:hypothetical protein